MRFAKLLNMLAIVANVIAYAINLLAGNFIACMVATVWVAANVACLMLVSE